jgi:PRTRC genetic system protein B
MDRNGQPVNAHPLTQREASQLAKALKIAKAKKEPCLKINGILGSHILHLDPQKGKAIWFTKAGQRELYFVESLGIPNGRAGVPPMLWAANRNSLFVFALKSNRRPNESTSLYYAPFFNVYENGNVCMGTVDVQIKKTASLEEFTAAWEQYFFKSYFSHLNDQNPINGNCVCLWKDLVNTDKHFPKDVLKKTNKTLKNLLP